MDCREKRRLFGAEVVQWKGVGLLLNNLLQKTLND